MQSKIRVSIVLIFREEYFAMFSEFEESIPNLYTNRVRIEKLNKNVVEEIIEKPCRSCQVKVEAGLPKKVAELLARETGQIELTWFQILMDKLYKLALARDPGNPELQVSDLDKIGDIGNILGDFLNEQLLGMENATEVETVLKTMISEDGTKKQITLEEIHHSLDRANQAIGEVRVRMILKDLVDRRIVSEKDEHGNYEIKHDSLAIRIYERLTAEERKLKEIEQLIKNAHRQYLLLGTFMPQNTLKFIEPYYDKLLLSGEINEFVEESRKKINRIARRKRNILVGAASIIVVLALIIGFFGYRGKLAAELQQKIAQSRELANKAFLYVEDDPTKAYLLAEQAYNIYPTFESESAILNAYKNAPFYGKIDGNHFVISKSQNYILAISSMDNDIRIYDFLGNLLATCTGHKGPIQSSSLKISDDEKYILSESVIDSTVRIWDISGKELFHIDKGGYKLSGFLAEDKVYLLSKDDYQLYETKGKQLLNLIFERPVLKIKIDSTYACIVNHDTVIEIKTLPDFLTISKSEKLNDFDIDYSLSLFSAAKQLAIYKSGKFNYSLWKWGVNDIFSLNDNSNNPNRDFWMKNDYIIDYDNYFNRSGAFRIRDINTGKIVFNSFATGYDISCIDFLNDNLFILHGGDKSSLSNFNGIIINAHQGHVEDINLQSKLFITIDKGETAHVYHFDGRSYSSFDLKDIQYCKFIDEDKFVAVSGDNTVSLYNTDGRLLMVFKGIPKTLYTQVYTIKNYILVIRTGNGLYTLLLGKDNINEIADSKFGLNYIEMGTNNQIFGSSILNIKALDSRMNLLTLADSANYFNTNAIKISPDNKYLAIVNDIFINNSPARILSILSWPDFRLLYKEKSEINNNVWDAPTICGIEFLNSDDTSCILYFNNKLKYLDNQFKIIDGWPIHVSYSGYADLFYSNWVEIKNGNLLGYNSTDSSFKLYDCKHRDSVVLIKSVSNFTDDKDRFIFNYFGNELINYNQADNKIYVLTFDLDTLDIIQPLGKKAFNITSSDQLLFISSIEIAYDYSGSQMLRTNEVPNSYLQIYDLENKKMIHEQNNPHIKEVVRGYSSKSGFISVISVSGRSIRHDYYADIRNLNGQSLIKFQTFNYLNFSDDGNYLSYYQMDINKLVIFPLKATEVISRVRELKEFGNIYDPKETEDGFIKYETNSNDLKEVNPSKSISPSNSNVKIQNIKEFDRLIQFYNTLQNRGQSFLLAKNNIQTYYWNDYDKLAKTAELFLENSQDNDELVEIASWAERSVSLENFIYNKLLLSKIYFKMGKNRQAIQIINEVVFQKLTFHTCFEDLISYLYNFFEPADFQYIIDNYINTTPDNAELMYSISSFYYENVIEDELLEKALALSKKSIDLDRKHLYLDTYASLLYKLGQFDRAVEVEKQAIDLAKATGEDWKEYEKLLEKIYKAKGYLSNTGL
jgi:hypothetical protein